jgi:hypothetical protein
MKIRPTARACTAVLLVAVLGAAFLGACTSNRTAPYNASQPFLADTWGVLDDFETDAAWCIDSAENHGLIQYSTDHATSGARALHVTAFKRGRDKTAVRKEVNYDLSHVSRFMVDVYNAGTEPVPFALAFKVSEGDRWFETLPFMLQPGANNGIVFPINRATLKPLDGPTTYDDWLRLRGEVMRLLLLFYENGNEQNELYVDNVRCDQPTQTVDRRIWPRITSVEPSARMLGIYRRLEIAVEFDGAFSNPFDTEDVAIYAEVQTPSGAVEHVPGFLLGHNRGHNTYQWCIRYAPRQIGQCTYDVYVRTRKGSTSDGPFTLDVVEDDAPGFIRVSETDPTMFEDTRGGFFYPFGENVCWASDYGYYFRKMHDYGATWVRVWMCPWNLWLEGQYGPAAYDLRAADELDRVVELAEQYGIRIQLVLDYHGVVGDNWKRHPYNVQNGGPCASPEDFWTNDEAKRLYKRRLDYIAARWGASSSIFAWELFNEVNLTRRWRDDDVIAWHREMACYLKSIDVYGHLVSTSTSGAGGMPGLWTLPDIDFTQSHFYTDDVAERFAKDWYAYRRYKKPYFVAEFGRGGQAHHDTPDTDGVLLSAGLWLAATTPAAGSAMSWWWDTYIDPNDLYGRFRAIAPVIEGDDRRGRHDEFFQRSVPVAASHDIRLQGIANRTSALVYVFDPQRILEPKKATRVAAVPQPFVLKLDGMLWGDYAAEIYRTESGGLVDTLDATAKNGRLEIHLPQSDEPLAVKVTRVEPAPIELDLTPQDE